MPKLRLFTNEEFGMHLRTMRKSHKMTQEDLGKAIGQTAGSIGMYETGKRMPERDVLEALADVFNVGTQSLLYAEPNLDEIDNENNDSSHAPQTFEAQIISNMVDKLTKSQREKLLVAFSNMFDVMFDNDSKERK